jgi:hypothetical protein
MCLQNQDFCQDRSYPYNSLLCPVSSSCLPRQTCTPLCCPCSPVIKLGAPEDRLPAMRTAASACAKLEPGQRCDMWLSRWYIRNDDTLHVEDAMAG